MTTTVAPPPEVKVDRDPMRILSITANLLPVEITDARRENKVRWIAVGLIVVVAAGLGYWDFAARQNTSDAQSTLTKTQQQVASIKQSQEQYKDLSTAKSGAAAIDAELAKLMATDVAWYELVPSLRAAAQSAGVTISNISATLQTAGTATTTSGAGGAATSVGNIQMVGSSPDKTKAAAFLDALAKVPGLSTPTLGGLTSQSGAYQFTTTVTFTSSLFKGRFTPATTTGGK